MDANTFLQKLTAAKIAEIARQVLEDNADVLADLNAQQLAQGISSDGEATTLYGNDYYAPLTVELKTGKPGLSGVTDRVTGYDTGSLYRNLYARVQGEKIEYGSTSDTAELFEDQASNRIYGPTEENRIEFIETVLQPRFLDAVQRALD